MKLTQYLLAELESEVEDFDPEKGRHLGGCLHCFGKPGAHRLRQVRPES